MRVLTSFRYPAFPSVALLVLLLLWLSMRYFVINISPSMPMGLYVKTPISYIAQGDIVIACLPESVARSAYNAGIINKSHTCSHGYQPLMKQVIATANDAVSYDNQQIIVNGKSYVAPVSTDHTIPNTIGTPDFNKTGVWLYGAGHPQKSWDSRYFGALDASSIQNAVRGVWVAKSNHHSSKTYLEANHV